MVSQCFISIFFVVFSPTVAKNSLNSSATDLRSLLKIFRVAKFFGMYTIEGFSDAVRIASIGFYLIDHMISFRKPYLPLYFPSGASESSPGKQIFCFSCNFPLLVSYFR